jgi:hypothetical protein
MINNISETTLRIASKIDPSGAIHDKEVTAQKAKELRKARPVEKSEQGNQAQVDSRRKKEDSSRYLMDDNRIVFEKYNKNGDLIFRLPPSDKPVDKHV